MSHRSVVSVVLATVLCGAAVVAHADSWRNHGNHEGRNWRWDHGNRGHDSYYDRRFGDHDRWGDSSRWRPHYDYRRDWWAGREWRDNDWDRRWDEQRYHRYRPYYRDNYYRDNYYRDYDRGDFGGGWLDLILSFPLF
jgi:hypothetical protein